MNRKVGIVFDIVECPVDHLSGRGEGGKQGSRNEGKSTNTKRDEVVKGRLTKIL